MGPQIKFTWFIKSPPNRIGFCLVLTSLSVLKIREFNVMAPITGPLQAAQDPSYPASSAGAVGPLLGLQQILLDTELFVCLSV